MERPEQPGAQDRGGPRGVRCALGRISGAAPADGPSASWRLKPRRRSSPRSRRSTARRAQRSAARRSPPRTLTPPPRAGSGERAARRAPPVGTKAGFVLDHDEPITITASRRRSGRSREARLHAVGPAAAAGYVLELETPERLERSASDELEALLADDASRGARRAREGTERDEGYIPGSRTSRTGLVACLPRRARQRPARWSRSAPAARAPAWPRAFLPPRASGRGRC
jgi:hypothetical protein